MPENISTSAKTRSLLIIVLAIAVCIEVLSNTFLLHKGNLYWVPFSYFAAGLLIALIPLFKPAPGNIKSGITKLNISRIYSLLFFIALVIFMVIRARELFLENPVDYKYADMLPVIQVMCERFIHHQPVYAPIGEIWEGIQPIYLPVLWLSYLPAVLFGVDIRWMSVLFLIVTCFLILKPYKSHALSVVLLWAPLSIVIIYIFYFGYNTIILTEEAPVILFHVLLGYALIKKKPVFIGITLSLCLLSRYIITMWVPCMLIYMFISGNRKAVWKIMISSAVCVGVLMFISGAIYHIDLFIHLPSAYIDSLYLPENINTHNGIISSGLSFAKFIAYEDLGTLTKLLPWICLTSGLFTILAAYIFKLRNISTFLLSSLKIYLVTFFALISIPYPYLFFTCTFFSLVIFEEYLNRQYNLKPAVAKT